MNFAASAFCENPKEQRVPTAFYASPAYASYARRLKRHLQGARVLRIIGELDAHSPTYLITSCKTMNVNCSAPAFDVGATIFPLNFGLTCLVSLEEVVFRFIFSNVQLSDVQNFNTREPIYSYL